MNIQAPPPPVLLALDALTLDVELQPRVAIDRPTYEDYGHALVDGVTLPPVLVVTDGASHWLADGYHRWHAHKALGIPTIAAEVRPGTRADALRLSLAANAEHGKRRTPNDLKRAYELAVRNGLVASTDVEGLAELLRCSGRWAEVLTKAARDAAWEEREAALRAAEAAGEPVRETARRLGVDPATVSRKRRVAEAKPSQTQHPSAPSAETEGDAMPMAELWQAEEARQSADGQPVPAGPSDKVRAALAELESEPLRLWSDALAALRGINALPSPQALYAKRFAKFDHAIGPELVKARVWINSMERRFFQ